MGGPVVVLAPGRSYTSLVSTMLGQHPEMYGFPELNLSIADTIRGWWIKCGAGRTARHHGLLRAVAELYCGEQTEETIGEAYRWLRGHVALDTGAVFHLLTDRIAPRIAVEKSPLSMNRDDTLGRLVQFFPNARFVHLLRHPRSTCSSIVQTEWARMMFAKNNPDECDFSTNPPTIDPQLVWYKVHERIRRFTDWLPQEQSLRIIGEELLAEPDRHLRDIAGWLGLSDDDAAVDEMKHPERSPFACIGPRNACYGADVGFLQSPQLRPFDRRPDSLEGPLPWRADGRGFLPEVKTLASELGYR